jgi:hypothetical protein
MALDFPNSPTNGQYFTAPNGTVWMWDTVKWVAVPATGGGGPGYLALSGGTMTGAIVLAGDPTVSTQAATKNYVDTHSAGLTDAPSDSTYYGRFNATWAHVAPLASPVFTGTPSMPTGATGITQTAGDNSTKLATTAYVATAITNAAVPLPNTVTTPIMDGTATIGVLTTYARSDHVHPTDTSRAPLASPTFTGAPNLPTGTVGFTQTAGNNSTALATTAFVAASFLTTGAAASTYAPLASPAFTGTPSLPTGTTGFTQTAGTSNTTLATTAFVAAAITAAGGSTPSNAIPAADSGSGSAGVATAYSRGDHVHPTDVTRAPTASPTFTGTVTIPTGASIAGFAPLASPGFSGVPTAPTASSVISTTQIATTQYVGNYYAPLASPGFSGAPTAPTPGSGTSTTQLATTAFVVTGITGGTNAAAGQIGEFLTASNPVSSATLSSGSPATLATLSLTAGDWDVWGEGWLTNGSAAMSDCVIGINTATSFVATPSANAAHSRIGVAGLSGDTEIIPTQIARINITTTTSVFLLGQCIFSTGTTTGGGVISARRRR